MAFAGDGGTFDIGFQALSGMLERGHNVLFVCYDNEAYMNTGIQRSSSTPHAASTTTSPAGVARTGKRHLKKDLLLVVAAHHVPYAATASVAFPRDLYAKVRRAVAIEGPTFLQVLSPCPLGWRHDSDATIEVARLACEEFVEQHGDGDDDSCTCPWCQATDGFGDGEQAWTRGNVRFTLDTLERLLPSLEGGDAPRLEKKDLAIARPRLVKQRERHQRALAGARRRLQHGITMLGECCAQRERER